MNRYPYHRYLIYQILRGDDVDDINDHMVDLEYIPPPTKDVAELASRLRRRSLGENLYKTYDVEFFDEQSESRDLMNWIVTTPVVRTCAERLLLDRVHPRHAATILGLKFNEALTIKAVEMFRTGFWDTTTLTPIDFENYFQLAGTHKPKPPPTSLAMRAAHSAWREGLPPDEEELSADAMVREIQTDAFMHFKEAAGDLKQAKPWAELVLKTAPARKALTDSGKSGPLPGVLPVLEYPDNSIPSLGDLHTEYSEQQSGTGSSSEAMGEREDDG